MWSTSLSRADVRRDQHRSGAGTIRCSTDLTVVDGDELQVCDDDGRHVQHLESVADRSCERTPASSMCGEDEETKTWCRPAMVLRGPQDTTALVGDRVLLKATYVGQPEPAVKWTRAVSTP